MGGNIEHGNRFRLIRFRQTIAPARKRRFETGSGMILNIGCLWGIGVKIVKPLFPLPFSVALGIKTEFFSSLRLPHESRTMLCSRESGNRTNEPAVKHFQSIVFLLAAGFAAACALPYLQLRGEVDSLEGQPLSVAVARLGPPSVSRVESGKKINVWMRQETVDAGGDDQQCEILGFMKGDIVETIKYQGDETQCYRYAKTLGAK
jgi:hypothetical protein